MLNDIITRVTKEFTEEYDKRCYEILDNYFGKIPRDNDKLTEWFQEKRNQGYVISTGEDLRDMGMMNGTQVHFLTIKYDKEIVLKEVLITLDINTIFKE